MMRPAESSSSLGSDASGVGNAEFDPIQVTDAGGTTGQVTVQKERASWDNKIQFMLSVIGYAVGLGNVWRFPYLCQQNGGGAFLIPYFIMLVIEGVPLFYMELAIGQRLRKGSLGVWNSIHPLIGGIGLSSTVVSFTVGLYYNVIICWCFYYLFNSFTATLPWSSCPNDGPNGTINMECAQSSETAFFWYRHTLDVSPSIEEPEGIKWWMALCLLLSWIVVYGCIRKGIKSSGKVVYFTATFPYLILTIFFFRAVTLEGAGSGLKHMLTPKLDRLKDPTVWMDAATQIFYSLGLGFGSLIAYASYNPPKNNCRKDALIVSITNCSTSVFASIVVFSVLGFKAVLNHEKCIHLHELAHNLSEVIPEHNCSLENQLNQAAEGTGLAFIVFTQAIVELPGGPFWAICFFLMLISLGLGSQFGTMEGVITTVFDMKIFRRFSKSILSGGICVTCFLVGLIFTTGAGEYWLKLFDSFAGTVGLVMIALMEMLAVCYVYGYKKFALDIEDMTGERPGWYWCICWNFISPVVMFIILVASLVFRFMNPPTYLAWDRHSGETVSREYPTFALIVAGMLAIAGILPPFVVFLVRKCQGKLLTTDDEVSEAELRRVGTASSTLPMIARETKMNCDNDLEPIEESGYSNLNTVTSVSQLELSLPLRAKFHFELADD
ncbi:Sodium-dependent neutral amino acid transporter B(0)AT3 [Amphibalanus amphitrite]|uniref:Transporter n=1 Tax=Amphibalanus amphitrite TaxID=1232801 RepID=A0A6A4WJP4_AMPAM|nr:Sodium-dependent neutral amino acid transporter B(0)AT3 [Amphibalanus amphitrite]KAF0303871.1 Sodium-dependent neutral amino acid transporter B(0)AT3 [Amphibalanus amphitrite]